MFALFLIGALALVAFMLLISGQLALAVIAGILCLAIVLGQFGFLDDIIGQR